MQKEKVSCIIAAHNEEKRIENVLKIVYNHPLLSEIIIVQNFSVDDTSYVVKKFIKKYKAKKIKLVEEYKHKGKAYAMYYGVKLSKCPIILFLDADLVGLNQKNITDLIIPVINNEVDMTIGFRGDVHFLMKPIGFDPWGGERVMKKKIFLQMPDYKSSKYGIESLINNFLVKLHKKIKIVPIINVKNTRKHQKINPIKGHYEDIVMIKQIFSTIPLFTFIRDSLYIKKMQKDFT